MSKKKFCSVKQCGKSIEARGYCIKHYKQIIRHGRVSKRTRTDKNQIRKKNNYWEMDLYNRQQKITAITLFDQIDKLNKIKKYKWCLVKKGKYGFYVKTDIKVDEKRKTLYLHDLLIGDKNGLQVDHINGITLDNRQYNLRIVTQQQNLINKTRAKGYSWNKKLGKWEVYIGINKKRIRLGFFKQEEEAQLAREKAESFYYGLNK